MIGLSISSKELQAAADEVIRAALSEVTAAVAEETRGLEKDLEKITRLAIKGKLWRAWASESFPRSGPAREPSGSVFLNGKFRTRGAIEFFTQEGRIRGKSGQYLAIPLPAAGPRGRLRDLTPGEWERRNGAQLRFVYRPGKPSLLVLDEGVLSKKHRYGRLNTDRRRKTGRGNTTVPIFVLVPFVDFKPAFAIEPIVQRRQRLLQDNLDRRLNYGNE